jgi:hypothetical protein
MQNTVLRQHRPAALAEKVIGKYLCKEKGVRHTGGVFYLPRDGSGIVYLDQITNVSGRKSAVRW